MANVTCADDHYRACPTSPDHPGRYSAENKSTASLLYEDSVAVLARTNKGTENLPGNLTSFDYSHSTSATTPRTKEPRAEKSRPSTSSSSTNGFAPPPRLLEQRLARIRDVSITPASPYLIASLLLDVGCDLPVLKYACPDADAGGWRSALPNPEWGTFPQGKLSHTMQRDWFPGERLGDMTFGDYRRLRAAGRVVQFEGYQNTEADGGMEHQLCHNHPAVCMTPRTASGGETSPSLLRDLYGFAFDTNNSTLSDLTHPSSLSVLFVIVLLIRAFKRVALPRFSNLGRRLGRSAHGPGWEKENEERVINFGEYVYRLLYHSAVSIYGVWYFWNKSWWDASQGGTMNFWIDYGYQTIEPGMAWYFLVQAAYNVDALVSLLELSFVIEWARPLAANFSRAPEKDHIMDDHKSGATELPGKGQIVNNSWRLGDRSQAVLQTPLFKIRWSGTARGDFNEMFAHHLVTNTIIFFCSYTRFTRIGSMVFLIHDVSDVPIDMSKLANFVKWKVTTVACFAIMCVTWVVCRLYFLPFVVCGAIVNEAHDAVTTHGSLLDPAVYHLLYFLPLAGLGALVGLHVMWFMILLRIGWALLTKGETHDYSEHKSGES